MSYIKCMKFTLWTFAFLSLTLYLIYPHETYHIKDIENTTNHTIGNTNYTVVENVENVKKYMKYTEVKNLNFDLVYEEYVKKHNRIVSELLRPSAKLNSSELPKLVVVEPVMTNGFGNRIPSMVCGFMYSLLSDRLFFISGYDNFTNYFEKDFEHDWKTVADMYENSTSRYIHDANSYNDFELVARGNLSNDETDILYLRTWDYPCAPIMSNPHYKEWFNKTIPDYRVFTALSLKLIRLKQYINKQADAFADNNFTDYNIGIHLRERKTTWDMITPPEHFCNVVKMLLLEMKNMNITVFVAADNNNGRNKLVNLLREMDTYNNNTVNIVHTDDDMDALNPVSGSTGNTGSEVVALIDMKVLSLCDDLVITYGSSFGFIAAGWSQKAYHRRGPLVIMPITNSSDDFQDVDKVWVYGAVSNEPCMFLSKWVIAYEDEETSSVFKSNPLWMHYSQCHAPTF